MDKPQLTIEEFRELPLEIKCERYPEMSDHDKFLARIEAPTWPSVPPENPINTDITTLEQLVELINNGYKR